MGTLKTTNIQTITGSGTLTLGTSGETLALGSGVTSNLMYPAFYRVKTSGTSITNETFTRMSFDTERFDTDNAMTDTTFTVPSGKAGKYFFHATCIVDANAVTQLGYINSKFYKNGSQVNNNLFDFRNNYVQQFNIPNTVILDLVAGDYIELYIRGQETSGNPNVNGSSGEDVTNFMGYRIGT